MEHIGKHIKRLRTTKNITQEQLANVLHISYQAVSKWENESAFPDISLLPLLADYFGVTMDELFGYRLNHLTYKERFVKFMLDNNILQFGDFTLKHGAEVDYYINAENFTTNAQISKIGEFFADCIRKNNIAFDTIIGLAYHGIAFSSATAFSLYQKYGITTNYCYDRMVADSHGRMLCGYTLQKGDKVVIVDDIMSSGKTLDSRLTTLLNIADIEIAAIIVIADRNIDTGSELIEEKYHTKVYSIINDSDIRAAITNIPYTFI